MGRGTVELFAQEGCRVVVADIQDDLGRELEGRFPGAVIFTHCDVSQETEIAAAVALAESEFGGLDIVFNNAGRPPVGGTIEEMTVDGWDSSFAVLLRSQMLVIKHSVPLLKARGGGSIINNSSGTAIFSYGSSCDYGTAKAGVIQMTRLLAPDLGPHLIRVNAIVPGWIKTPIVGALFGASLELAQRMTAHLDEGYAKLQPLPIAGEPQHIAEAVLFLGSDASNWITGVALPVDGGLLVRDQRDPLLEGIVKDAWQKAQAELSETTNPD
jgi:NAD(P)-dependent dehydrogenase (short-subunit alcohol dehydrogenase family)